MRWLLLVALAAGLVAAPSAGAWAWPTDGPVLRAFSFGGNPYAAGLHRGVDIGGPPGGTVVAAAGGTVSFAGTVPSGGQTVTVQTADGYSVTLVHLGSITAQRGAEVAEGSPVGTVGPTGDAELGEPYVHLGVRVSSEPEGYVDPLGFLPARGAPVATASTAEPPAASPSPVPATVPSTATPPASAPTTAPSPPAPGAPPDAPGAEASAAPGSQPDEASSTQAVASAAAPAPSAAAPSAADPTTSATPPRVPEAASPEADSPSAETGAAVPVAVDGAGGGTSGPAAGPNAAAVASPAAGSLADVAAPSGRDGASPDAETGREATAAVSVVSTNGAEHAVQQTAATGPAAEPVLNDARAVGSVAGAPADGETTAGPPTTPPAVTAVESVTPAAAEPPVVVPRPEAGVQQTSDTPVDVPAEAAAARVATGLMAAALGWLPVPSTPLFDGARTRAFDIAAVLSPALVVQAVRSSAATRGASVVAAAAQWAVDIASTSRAQAKPTVQSGPGTRPAGLADHARRTVHNGTRAHTATRTDTGPARELRLAPVLHRRGPAVVPAPTTQPRHDGGRVVRRSLPLVVLGALAALMAGSAAFAAVVRRRRRRGATLVAPPHDREGDAWSDEEPTVLPDVDALLRDIARVEARRARMRAVGHVELPPPDDPVAGRPSEARERVLV